MLGDGRFKIEFQRPRTAADRERARPGRRGIRMVGPLSHRAADGVADSRCGVFILNFIGVPMLEAALTHGRFLRKLNGVMNTSLLNRLLNTVCVRILVRWEP